MLKKEFFPKYFPIKKAEISEIHTKETKNNKACGESKNKVYKEQYKDPKIKI